MLHKTIADKHLAPEVRLLHELKIQVSNKDFRQRLSREVRAARAKFTVSGRDALVEKLNRYGNHGAWAEKKIEELHKQRTLARAMTYTHGKNCCCIYC